MTLQYLVVDVRRVLDESSAGRAASAALQARFDEARGRWQALTDQAASARADQRESLQQEARAFEESALRAFAEEREQARTSLLQSCAPLLAAIAEARAATLVLDRESVLLFDASADVTDELIARLDAA